MIGFLLLPLAITVLALGRLLPIMIAGVLLLAVAVFALSRVTRPRIARPTATDVPGAVVVGTAPGSAKAPRPTRLPVEFPHPVFSELPDQTGTVSATANSTTEFVGSAR